MRLLNIPAIALGIVSPLMAQQPDRPPDSTEALCQKFSRPKPAGTLRVPIAGAGSSHNFPRYYTGTDSETLKAEEGVETAATLNAAEAIELMPQADVMVFSGSHEQFGRDN